MKHWWVVSPEMSEVVPVTDDGQGPLEYFCDVECVAAPTKRKAIALGVARMKKWPHEARSDGCNPFAGVTAKNAECPHGVCCCDLKECANWNDYCEKCEEETCAVDLRIENHLQRHAGKLEVEDGEFDV